MTGKPIEVKTCRESEILAALHASAFKNPWMPADFEALLAQAGSHGFLALQSDNNAGFLLLRCAGGEAEILSIGVAPAVRRSGVADKLIAEAICFARISGAEQMFLEVAEDNAAALHLYRKHGFVTAGRRADYYGTRDSGPAKSALVMRLDLRS